MSSIVLDFDLSIRYSTLYWEGLSLSEQVKEIFGDSPIEKRALSYSLVYYHRDTVLGAAKQRFIDLLDKLEHSKLSGIYDGFVLSKISAAGIELPSQKKPFTGELNASLLSNSLALIKEAWPAGYSEILNYVTGYVVLEDYQTRSLTSPQWFGAIFLGHTLFDRNDLVEVTTSIVHETGHLSLFANSSIYSPLADLIVDLFSPFKKVDRPAYMVLHAQIALARMLIWLFSLKRHLDKDSKIEIPNAGAKIQHLVDEFSGQYLDGMKSLEQMRFTSKGEELFVDFRKIESILKEANNEV